MLVQYMDGYKNIIIPESWDQKDTILIYSDKDLPPERNDLADICVPLHEYKGKYLQYGDQYSKLIIVGYSDMIGPSNRTLPVFEYWQDHSHSKDKIVVDRAPFRKEPWRFWYSFAATKQNPWGWAHSYATETEWKHWFEGSVEDSDSPFYSPNLKSSISSLSIVSYLPKLDSTFSFIEPDKNKYDKYTQVKEQAFQKYSTPKQLIAYMSKNIPLNINFDSYLKNKHFEVLDIPIARFVANENMRRQSIYNILTKNG